MIISTSDFETPKASIYLGELCEHFAKRVPVDVDETAIRVTLPIGICDLAANKVGITARIQSNQEHVTRMEEVFGGWIERIAFREKNEFDLASCCAENWWLNDVFHSYCHRAAVGFLSFCQFD